jgi:hypothetical protein
MDEIWKGHPVEVALAVWERSMIEDGIDFSSPEYALNDFRTVGTVHEMLNNYMELRESFLNEVELVICEKPFAVPIDESGEVYYVGRLDKLFKRKGRTYVGEHKTTSMYAKAGGFRSTWVNSFSPNPQIDGYAYAATLLYDDFKAVWVDAALTHKTVHDKFMFIPLERSRDMMELWLWETNRWVGLIQQEVDQLDWIVRVDPTEIEKQKVMNCFPRSAPDACIQYNRECVYKDLCMSWPNPNLKDCPQDFVQQKWEPFDEFKIEELGLKKDI